MAFSEKGRIPVRPLDYKTSNNGELAMNKEMLVDYDTAAVYVKTKDGRIINIYASEATKTAINECIEQSPDLITGANLYSISEGDEKDATVKDVIKDIDSRVSSLEEYNHDDYFDKTKDNDVNGVTTFKDIIKIDINNPNICGTDLPENPVEGQLFFKQVIED